MDLLTDQVEFANVIILNKTDLVTKQELNSLKETLNKLNPSSKIIESTFSKINPKEILNTECLILRKQNKMQVGLKN